MTTSLCSTYSQFQPDSVFDDECPCANTDDGYDSYCPQHGVQEDYR